MPSQGVQPSRKIFLEEDVNSHNNVLIYVVSSYWEIFDKEQFPPSQYIICLFILFPVMVLFDTEQVACKRFIMYATFHLVIILFEKKYLPLAQKEREPTLFIELSNISKSTVTFELLISNKLNSII